MVPSGWQKKKISEILERVTNPVKVIPEEMYHQIGIRSHAKGIFYKEPVTGKELGNKRVFYVCPGCFIVNIVFAWEQAVAKTTKQEEGMIASHRFPMFKPKDNLCDIDFILYLFKTKYGKHLLGLASPGGAGRNKTLGQTEFARLEVLIPPLIEQKKISQILSSWDLAIETVEKIIENCNQQKTAIVQQLLTGNKRFPGFAVQWEEHILDKLFKFKKGKGLSKTKLDVSGIYNCVLYGELYTKYGEVIEKVVSRTNYEEGEKSMSGDILIPSSTTTSGIDLANAVAIFEENVLIGGDINILRPNKKMVNSEFFAYLLTHIKKFEIAAKAQGITIIHLYGDDLKSLMVFVPDLEEQKKIASVLSTINKEIKCNQDQLKCLKEEKKALMHQLITGNRRVKIDSYESSIPLSRVC